MERNSPPQLFVRFFRKFCDPELHLAIEGDLIELYEERCEKHSKKIADLRFALDVLLLFRPSMIRSLASFNKITNYMMLRHSLLISWRSVKRHKRSFAINLVGLAAGLACALFIFLWVQDEMKFDKFHINDDRLYQVMQNLPHTDEIMTISSTPGPLADALMEEMPEVELASTVIPPEWLETRGILSIGEDRLKATAQVVDNNYLKLFSWEILEGDRDQVLLDHQSVLISDRLSRIMFEEPQKAIGQTIEWDQEYFSGLYKITGVFADPPDHSTQDFDLLFEYGSFYDAHASNLGSWGNSGPDTYLLLRPGTNIADFNEKIKDYRKSKYEEFVGGKYLDQVGSLFVQKFSDRYLRNRFENGVQAGGRISYLKLFVLIGAFLLIVAGINFMNLSTAKAMYRMREIGIKKSVGAGRNSLIMQFMMESLLIAFLALLLAGAIVFAFLPEFNQMSGKSIAFSFSPDFCIAAIVITLTTGLLAGSYPAFYLSSFSPVNILKGKLSGKQSDVLLRRGLVVFQFTISTMLMMAVLIVGRQIEFIHSTNLGYDRDNVIVFDWEGEDNVEPFLQGLDRIPGVMQTSTFGHDMIGDYGGTGAVSWQGKAEGERIQFANLEVDYDWFELLQIKMAQGRSYDREFGAETDKIIFNETAVDAMGLQDPIGKIVTLWGKEREIIGVAEDFNFASLYEEIKPCFIQCYPNLTHVLVKLRSGNQSESIEQIGTMHGNHNAGLPFEYRFIDNDYQSLYAAEHRVAILSKYFAALTILISCLGLFGLAVFTAERRTKEIGVRKVLGATSTNIVMLFTSDITKMITLSIVIALPLSYFILREWLNGFSYRMDLGWWPFLVAAFFTLMVAWISVAWQTVKMTQVDPSHCLKYE